jgi:hypothetical protein
MELGGEWPMSTIVEQRGCELHHDSWPLDNDMICRVRSSNTYRPSCIECPIVHHLHYHFVYRTLLMQTWLAVAVSRSQFLPVYAVWQLVFPHWDSVSS